MIDANILFIIGAWIFWGSYPAPFKAPATVKANIDPFVFQCMKSACVCLTSWVVLLWRPFTFTYWGFAGAAIWVPAGISFIISVKLTGVAFASPIANGTAVCVSFCWGAFHFKEEVHHAKLSALALCIMVVGMCGISYAVNYEKLLHKRNEAQPRKIDPNLSINEGLAYSVQVGEEQQPSYPPLVEGKNGADEVVPLLDKDNSVAPERKKFVLGVISALTAGVLSGSQSVPLKYAPPDAHGIQYVISFGIGAVICITILTTIYCIFRYARGMGPPIVNLKVSLLPGILAGCCWSIGNICNIYLILAYGQAIGAPLASVHMCVAGMWGIFFYNEAPRISMKLLFFGSSLVLMTGVAWLSRVG